MNMNPSVLSPAGSSENSQPGGATVLVVDDYRSLCEITAAMLRSRGYRVLMASSGEEAKTLVRENARIDLLLTDVEMPQMRGDELALWFRDAKPEAPILFMSNQRAPMYALRLFRFHFLQKPFHTETLINKVREALDLSDALPAEMAAP
jgi:two-component system cell cycle sensor histidine kinase/response regulator CckA